MKPVKQVNLPQKQNTYKLVFLTSNRGEIADKHSGFQLDIHEGSQQLLDAGQIEARRVVNEIFRLDDEGYDWETIEDKIVERSNHVQNTTQRLFDKATDALERYYDEDDLRVKSALTAGIQLVQTGLESGSSVISVDSKTMPTERRRW